MLGLVLCAVPFGAMACGRVPPLANTHESPEAVAAAVLDAFARRDEAGLRALALNEREFREHVWPDLPAARPERNLPFSFVWGRTRQQSDQRLRVNLARHGARRYELMAVRFGGEASRYGRYTVHRDTILEVARDGEGSDELRLFGSLVELDGAWKVYSYNVND